LTVTTSRERVGHLVEACRALSGGGSRLFLFTDQESWDRKDILGHEWVNGRRESVWLVEQNLASSFKTLRSTAEHSNVAKFL
jgi:hypothetical protein